MQKIIPSISLDFIAEEQRDDCQITFLVSRRITTTKMQTLFGGNQLFPSSSFSDVKFAQ
jgi:hypothetical protein